MDTTKATGLALATFAMTMLLSHCDEGPGFAFVRGNRAPKAAPQDSCASASTGAETR